MLALILSRHKACFVALFYSHARRKVIHLWYEQLQTDPDKTQCDSLTDDGRQAYVGFATDMHTGNLYENSYIRVEATN
jgi:hypothetical protein